jgi:hypothetical protein|tara:strand:+ start:837 stop:1211 length:375 start_codon:yes stop_codon:yes gene_type:complete
MSKKQDIHNLALDLVLGESSGDSLTRVLPALLKRMDSLSSDLDAIASGGEPGSGSFQKVAHSAEKLIDFVANKRIRGHLKRLTEALDELEDKGYLVTDPEVFEDIFQGRAASASSVAKRYTKTS